MMSNSAGESGGDDNGSDGKKGGKRELSTSKRAAQNRAAQVRISYTVAMSLHKNKKSLRRCSCAKLCSFKFLVRTW